MKLDKTSLGIELGSTRIKAVLIDDSFNVLAQGSFIWENKYENDIWTYDLNDALVGIKKCYAELKTNFESKFNMKLTEVGSIGISGMMHGYLAFDEDWNLLVPFRTWRNTITKEASDKLTSLFNFNIPQRWSIAHLYQAILNGEKHVKKIRHLTTLAGYVHYLLTNNNCIGLDEASGMFPIKNKIYDSKMMNKFNNLISDYPFKLEDILPKALNAGENAGRLTKEGALLLDASGDLKEGIVFCPPEGDAATGMVATNSVSKYSGNVSCGTSDFAMIVVDHELHIHKEIDMVTTPDGLPVAMVHCNNCTSDINAWVALFKEVIELCGNEVDIGDLYTRLFEIALNGDDECGNLLSYNYYSGESITELDKGRPLLIRNSDSKFNLANFMKMNLFSSLATLKIGLDLLNNEENVKIEKIYGHGGLFKTPIVGQSILSAAIKAPVYVFESAGEGGPYGMALLASYLLNKDKNESLSTYLDSKVFKNIKSTCIMADERLINSFDLFVKKYIYNLNVERVAVEKGQ